MDFVKKNLLSLVFALIAIAAIVTSFWPLGSYYDDLQAELDKSKVRLEKATKLSKTPRYTPVIAPGQKPETFTNFPTPRDIKDAKAAQEKLHNEGREILVVAVKDNILEMLPEGHTIDARNLATFNPDTDPVKNALLLVPKSLPDPTGNAPFAFQRQLEEEYKKLRDVVLKGGVPPAQAEIDKATKTLRELKNQDLQFPPQKDQPARNQKQVDDEFEEERVKIPGRLREEAASKYMIYIEPGVLQVDPSIKAGRPSKEQIWFAQSALWVQEDVVRAIREVNTMPRPDKQPAAANVTEAPVKRLVKLDIPLSPDMYQRGAGGIGAGGGESAPAAAPAPAPSGNRRGGGGYAPAAAAAPAVAIGEAIPGGGEPPKPNLSLSLTGRASNNLYDVVHFNLVVDIDARAAQMFLNQLSRGRLITVRKVDISRPDLTDAATFGYIYTRGKETVPVIQMNLDCEALMLREWTIPLMPTGTAPVSIREMLGVPATYALTLAPPKKEAEETPATPARKGAPAPANP